MVRQGPKRCIEAEASAQANLPDETFHILLIPTRGSQHPDKLSSDETLVQEADRNACPLQTKR